MGIKTLLHIKYKSAGFNNHGRWWSVPKSGKLFCIFCEAKYV